MFEILSLTYVTTFHHETPKSKFHGEPPRLGLYMVHNPKSWPQAQHGEMPIVHGFDQ